MTSDCVETPGVKKASWLSVTGCPKSTLFSGVGTGSIMQPVKVKHALSRATKLQLVILHVKLCMQMILADLKGCASFGMWSFVKSPELVESIICGLLNREDIMAALPQPLRSTVPNVPFSTAPEDPRSPNPGPEPRMAAKEGSQGRRRGRRAGPEWDRSHESRPQRSGPRACYDWSGQDDLNLRPPASEF